MYKTLFPDFDDQSKIWIYGLNKQISNKEKIIVEKYLSEFISTWKSHGDEVTGDFKLLFDRFIIIAAKTSGISGCSIDSCIKIFKELKQKFGLDALDLNLIYYRWENQIKSVKRFEFTNLIQSSEITPDTVVFDTSIQSLHQLRNGKFEIAARDSWHIGLFEEVA